MKRTYKIAAYKWGWYAQDVTDDKAFFNDADWVNKEQTDFPLIFKSKIMAKIECFRCNFRERKLGGWTYSVVPLKKHYSEYGEEYWD